jgi:hypothetical protein
VKDDDLDAGWDEPESASPPAAPAQKKALPVSAAPQLDELDASWDAPALRWPKRRKDRQRDKPKHAAAEPPPVLRPRPAAPAPSFAEARRLAKKRAAQTSAERKAEKRAKKEEKKRRQTERRAEALAKNKVPARGPRAPLRTASEKFRDEPAPPLAAPVPEETPRPPRERKRRRRRAETPEPAPQPPGRRPLIALVAVVIALLIAAWWLFGHSR